MKVYAPYTRDIPFHCSRSSLFASRIGAPRSGARGQAALSSNDLVCSMQQYPVVLQGGTASLLFGSLGCFVLGVASSVFLLDFELGALFPARLSFLLACFVRGFSHHFVSVRSLCLYL